MNDRISLEELAAEIRTISAAHSGRAEELIEDRLKVHTRGLPAAESLEVLDALREKFGSLSAGVSRAEHEQPRNTELLSDLFALLLGHRVSKTDLHSPEVIEALARAMNTIFDSLNEVVSTISRTFGDETEELQTIRHLISSDLECEGPSQPLESYLRKIKEAFLTANQAFRIAAQHEVGKILEELDPDRIASEAGKGFGLGFMRKSDHFDTYRARFEQFRKWLQSGRFLEDLSREFERNCQKLTSGKGGQGEKLH
jgi:hypothetical protein